MLNTIIKLVDNISSYLKQSDLTKNQTLAQVMNDSNAFTLLTHSIEPLTMPTHHRLRLPTIGSSRTRIITDESFATANRFLVQEQSFRTHKAMPTVEFEPNLLLMNEGNYDPTHRPVKQLLFNSRIHMLPDVLWFSPYNKSTIRRPSRSKDRTDKHRRGHHTHRKSPCTIDRHQ